MTSILAHIVETFSVRTEQRSATSAYRAWVKGQGTGRIG